MAHCHMALGLGAWASWYAFVDSPHYYVKNSSREPKRNAVDRGDAWRGEAVGVRIYVVR